MPQANENLQQTMTDLEKAPISKETVEKMKRLSDEWIASGRLDKAVHCLQWCTEHAEDHLQAIQKARLWLALGNLHRKLGQNRDAGNAYRHAHTLYKSHPDDVPLELASMTYTLGTFLESLMKLKPAKTYYEESLALLKAQPDDVTNHITAIQTRLDALTKKMETYKK